VCTVTVIAAGGALRLVHSRDEQRSRSPARPPAVFEIAGRRCVMPTDPDGGGSWVAAREDGVVLAVMNVNPEPGAEPDRGRLRSRGLIIPGLLGLEASAIGRAADGLEVGSFAPFRLVLARPGERPVAWTWRGQIDREDGLEREEARAPACWATSGLGDSVASPRLPLFGAMLGEGGSSEDQDAFHRHRWSARGAASVLMSRADAQTVSITTIETGAGGVRMGYGAVRPGGEAWDAGAWEVASVIEIG
jgi:hypothetical protein